MAFYTKYFVLTFSIDVVSLLSNYMNTQSFDEQIGYCFLRWYCICGHKNWCSKEPTSFMVTSLALRLSHDLWCKSENVYRCIMGISFRYRHDQTKQMKHRVGIYFKEIFCKELKTKPLWIFSNRTRASAGIVHWLSLQSAWGGSLMILISNLHEIMALDLIIHCFMSQKVLQCGRFEALCMISHLFISYHIYI